MDAKFFRRRLLAWYRREGRALPWRRDRNPYRIWVSEVMLQQTQVATVIPYFERFLNSFPTVRALAEAPLRRVLKAWEGLGYYARARNLHRAARQVAARFGGRIPSDPKTLRTLPGVGRSTAGAIASLAYGRRAPIMDANVRRVLCRLFAVREDPRLPAVERRLWTLAERLLPTRLVDRFNQALMDLGAMVCTASDPTCLLCPVRDSCASYRNGIQDRIPVRAGRIRVGTREFALAVITRGEVEPKASNKVEPKASNNKVLLGPRPEAGLLGGIWSFPESPEALAPEALQARFESQTGLRLRRIGPLDILEQRFTHLKVRFVPHHFGYEGGRPASPWRWVEIADLATLPVTAFARRVIAWVLPGGPGARSVSAAAAEPSPPDYPPERPDGHVPLESGH